MVSVFVLQFIESVSIAVHFRGSSLNLISIIEYWI